MSEARITYVGEKGRVVWSALAREEFTTLTDGSRIAHQYVHDNPPTQDVVEICITVRSEDV